MPAKLRWEYHVETVPATVVSADRLDALGRQGWELVAVRVGAETDQMIFKREGR